MTIKKTVITTSLLLAMGLTTFGFAETKMVDVNGVSTECITAEGVEAMSEEDKAKLTLPVCEDLVNEDGTAKTQ